MYKSSWKLSLHNAFLALIGFNHFYMCCFVMVLWGYCRFEIFCRFQHDSFLLFTLETDFWYLLVQIVFPQFCIYKKLKVCTKVNFDQKKKRPRVLDTKNWQKQKVAILKKWQKTTKWAKTIGKNKKWQFWKNGKKHKNGNFGQLLLICWPSNIIRQILSIWFPVRISKVWLHDENCELKVSYKKITFVSIIRREWKDLFE